MDAISYSYADKQAKRIKKFIENPDSTSGIITVPKVIAAGETITIPAGRVAVLPNVQVDGTLNISGEVFIPSGATTEDLDNRIALKADTTYVDTQIATRTRLVQGIAVNSTSGTAIDFTGIPSWAKRITVMFNGVSTSGSSIKGVRLGSVSVQTSGYDASIMWFSTTTTGNSAGNTTMFPLAGTSAADTNNGIMTFVLQNGNTWVSSYSGGMLSSVYFGCSGGGSVTLSGTLDRIRITTVNGTDTFDAGQINIMYEG